LEEGEHHSERPKVLFKKVNNLIDKIMNKRKIPKDMLLNKKIRVFENQNQKQKSIKNDLNLNHCKKFINNLSTKKLVKTSN